MLALGCENVERSVDGAPSSAESNDRESEMCSDSRSQGGGVRLT